MVETHLSQLLKPDDVLMRVADSSELCAGTFPKYVRLSWPGGEEVLEISLCSSDYLHVVRGQDGTRPQGFPVGTCVKQIAVPVSELPPAPCPTNVELSVTLPDVNIGEPYSHCIPIPGQQNIEIEEYLVPDEMVVTAISGSVCLTAPGFTRRDPGANIVIVVRDKITKCVVARISTSLNIVDPCYTAPECDVCVYSWSMTPALAGVGGVVTTTFTPPEGCPADTVLMLDVFMADGVTPFYVEGIVPPRQLQLSIPAGSSEYQLQKSDAGTTLVFKPSAQQQKCLEDCLPSIEEQVRTVLPVPPCSYCWSMNPTDVKPGDVITTIVDLPADCPSSASLLLDVFDLNSSNPSVPIFSRIPFPKGISTYTVANADGGQNLAFRPSTVQNDCLTGCTPCVTETRRRVQRCTYCWSMTPTNVKVGDVVVTTVSLPESCPRSATLKLDVYDLDSATPTVPILTGLEFPQGVSQYTIGAGDAGQNLAFRPSANQNFCLSGCLPCVAESRRIVEEVQSGCALTLSVTNQNITEAGKLRSYSIVSTNPLCTQASLRRVGTVNGNIFDVTDVVSLPYTFNDTVASAPGNTADVMVTAVGVGQCADSPVCGSPVRLLTNVPTSGLPSGVCVLLDACVPAPTPTYPNATRTDFVLRTPANTTVIKEQSSDGGLTWSTIETGTTFGTQALIHVFESTVASCPTTVLTPSGEAYLSTSPLSRRRVRIGNFVVPSCNATPPPPPPTPGCPKLADGFSPTPPNYRCGGIDTVNIFTNTPYTAAVDFVDTTSVSILGLPPSSIVTDTATSGAVYMSNWPEGTHTLVFRGTKAGCQDCVYTIRVIATTPAGTITEFVNTEPTITSCGQTSGALRVVGTPGMQIQIATNGTTNVVTAGGLGCGQPLTSFGPFVATFTIPPSGTLLVGGGDPVTSGILNVTWTILGTGYTATAAYNVPCSPPC